MVNCFCQWIIRRWVIFACGALLATFLVLHFTSLRHMDVTYDEPTHYQYAYRVLEGAPRRTGAINSSTMPFTSLHAMTSECLAVLANTCGFSLDKSWSGQIKRARYATVLFSLLLALYVSGWSYELYGRKGALFALSLFVFDPNLLAHGQLVTADLPAALMITMALYHFWRFLKVGGRGRALLSAVTLGLSQLAKYSCVYLYPIFLVTGAIYGRSKIAPESAITGWHHNLMGSVRRWSMITALFVVVSIVIINIGFEFDGFGTPLSKYHFKDSLFKRLQATPIIANLPVPLPVPYLQGLDLCKFEERMGQAWGNIYMAGTLRVNHHNGTLHGFPGYYFYAALFKVPIATQLIFLAALFRYFWRRDEAGRALGREELFLIVPMLVYWLYFNFFFNAQIGIRHVLPVFVLATVFCGSLLADPVAKWLQFTALILTAWVGVSTLSYYPHFLSYFNELVPDRKLAYRYLADSNLDWGGNEWYLAEYIRRHPGVVVDPGKPHSGRIVVPVNILVGIQDPERYRWLREHFTPVDHIAYSYLVYDVKKEMLPQAAPHGKDQTGSSSPSPHQ